MANYFGIPEDVEAEIRARDIYCAYCQGEMKEHNGAKGTPFDKVTLEHLSFDGPFYWKDGLQKEDIVMCCGRCNSSRGKKRLVDWFNSSYCIGRGINLSFVSESVKDFLRRFPDK